MKKKKGKNKGKGISAPFNIEKELKQAVRLHQSNRLADAAEIYQRILKKQPDHPDALHYTGLLAYQAGKYQEACRKIQKAIGIDPNNSLYYRNLGPALHSLGRLDEAIRCYEKALALRPNSPEVYGNMGYAYQKKGDLPNAIKFFSKAVQLKPDFVEVYISMGKAYADSGKLEESDDCYARALEKRPEYLDAIAGQVRNFSRRGDFDQALELVSPWLDSGNVGIIQAFAQFAGRFGMERKAIELLKKCLADGLTGDDQESEAHFNIGKLYDRIGEYDSAFSHFKTANGLKPWPFERERIELFVRSVISYTRDGMKSLPRATNKSRVPVFIIGMPRSGTSLVEQILASHPDVFGAGELSDLGIIENNLHKVMKSEKPYPLSLSGVTAKILDEFAGRYLKRLDQLSGGAKRVTDKMPGNFIRAWLIPILFPEARIIHCLRDPKDVGVSIYFQNFLSTHGYSFDLSNIGFYYNLYRRMMRHYRDEIGIPMLEVQYEELVENQEAISRKMIDYVGLSWDDRCLDFYRSDRTVLTSSVEQVRNPIYKNSVGRWKHYEKHIGPLLAALDEDLSDDAESLEKEFQKGLMLHQTGKWGPAESIYREILSKNPEHADSLHLLGVLEYQKGRYDKAQELIEKAVSLNDKNPVYLCNLGPAYQSMGNLDKAIAAYKKAVDLKPDYADAWFNLGNVLNDRGDVDEAIAAFQKAREIDPGKIQALSGEARVWSRKGEFEKARKMLEKPLKAGEPHAVLIQGQIAGKLHMEQEAIRDLEKLLSRKDIHIGTKTQIHFELGKLNDRINQFDKAFFHYDTGNKQKPFVFNQGEFMELVDGIISAYPIEKAGQLPKSSVASNLPIFIVGMPRSGTTLVEQILSSHDQVFGAGELLDINRMALRLPEKLGIDVRYPHCLAHLTPKILDELAEQHLEKLKGMAGGLPRVTDKLPQNFLRVGFIHQLFPNARIIHCSRNPLDNCLSVYFQNFSPRHAYSFKMEDTVFYYREYERIMNHWKRYPGIPAIEVHYEDLVANQEAETRRILAFLGLPWDDKCLRFHESRRAVVTSSYDQVREPIYNRSVGRWRNYEKYIGPFLDAFRPIDVEKEFQKAQRLHKSGMMKEASELYKRILRFEPNHADSMHMLGAAAAEYGKNEYALSMIRKAISVNPKNSHYYFNLGAVLMTDGKLDEALECHKKALEISPGNVTSIAGMAEIHMKKGELDLAWNLLSEKVEKGSKNISIAVGYAQLAEKYGKADKAIELLNSLIEKGGKSSERGARIHFSLGRLYDKMGEYDKAFQSYRNGNRLKPKEFQPQVHRKLVDRIIATYRDPEKLAVSSNHSELPVFILGMPRSGTSLTEQILSSHSMVFGAGELPDIGYLSFYLPKTLNVTGEYPECVTHLTREKLDELAETHVKRLSEIGGGAVRVSDKMPQNFLRLGLIAQLFPRAKIIHCRRDRMDTSLSIYFQNFSVAHAYAFNLEDIAFYYMEYERLMEHWRKVLDIDMLEVQYEDLVDNQETVTRRMLDFLGLSFEEDCLRFYKTKRSVITVSSNQVREPLHGKSVGRWRNYEAHLEPLEAVFSGKPTFNIDEGLKQAIKLHQSGNIDGAERIYRQVLDKDPSHPDGLHLLGVISSMRGNKDEAVRLIRRAIEVSPGKPVYHSNLGQALKESGRIDEAISSFQKALALNPDFGDAKKNLAAALREKGDKKEAAHFLKKALENKPDDPVTLFSLGNTYKEMRKYREAADCYQKAIELRPEYAEAHNNLGSIYQLMDRLEDAIACFRKTLRYKPNQYLAYCNIGDCLIPLGRLDESEEMFRKVYDFHPNHPDATAGIAQVRMRRGDFEGAMELLSGAVDAGIRKLGILTAFGQVAPRFGKEPEAIRLLEEALQNGRVREGDRVQIHFNLGRLYDKTGNYEKAFFHYREGNRLRPWWYDHAANEDRFERIMNTFTPEFYKKTSFRGTDSDLPVFIVGMPRSGTTLVEQIISSHSKAFGAGELGDITNIVREMPKKLGTDLEAPECVNVMTPEVLSELAGSHIERLRKFSSTALRVTDKMPQNFQHLGYIHLLFPNARVIHCMRDPRDTCLSIYFQNLSGGFSYAVDLRNAGRYYALYLRLMDYWRKVLPEHFMMDVRYEDLVNDPETIGRKMIAHVGLEWEDDCLRFYESDRPILTASYEQVRNPVYKSSSGRWKHYEAYLGPLMEGLEGKKPGNVVDMSEQLKEAVRLHQSGKFREADALYRKILDESPRHPDALHLSGVVAMQEKRIDDSLRLIRKAISIDPEKPVFYRNLGSAFVAAGKIDEALDALRKAVAIQPNYAEALFTIGVICQNNGREGEAIDAFQSVIRINPEYIPVYNNLGVIYIRSGDLRKAEEVFLEGLKRKPDSPEVMNNIGIVYQRLGRIDDAVRTYRDAISLRPAFPEALNSLGTIYKDMGRFTDALDCYSKCIAAKPDFADAVNSLAGILRKMGRLKEALDKYNQVLRMAPNLPQVHNNKGICLQDLRRPEEAIACFRKAVELDPAYGAAQCNLVRQLMHVCDFDGFEREIRVLEAISEKVMAIGGKSPETPMLSIMRTPDPSANRVVAENWSRFVSKRAEGVNPGFRHDPSEKKNKQKITVGYISSDFRNHPVAILMQSMFELHDRNDFQVFAYSFGKNDGSPFRKRIAAGCDRFMEMAGVSHIDAAKRMYRDGVDILVDLMGHTGDNRMEIAAMRPAPVQVSYLGFLGTTGADFIDYFITDRIVTPESHEPFYSEKFVYMPGCYQVNCDSLELSEKRFKRSDFGLPETGFVFCSFNEPYKIDRGMFDAWMRILKRVPGSVLWMLKKKESLSQRNLSREATKAGIDPKRLVFSGRIPLSEHFARLQLADLALDTRVYNGGATTSFTLWAGVPVVTLQGSHFVSRMSASALAAVGLTDTITQSLSEYEELAVKLANDPGALRSLREKLKKNRSTYPLFNTREFVRNLEKAYRVMWKRFLSGDPVERIDAGEGVS